MDYSELEIEKWKRYIFGSFLDHKDELKCYDKLVKGFKVLEEKKSLTISMEELKEFLKNYVWDFIDENRDYIESRYRYPLNLLSSLIWDFEWVRDWSIKMSKIVNKK